MLCLQNCAIPNKPKIRSFTNQIIIKELPITYNIIRTITLYKNIVKKIVYNRVQFHVLTKGSNKFDCLIKEMLFIRKLKPSLNVQADSIRAKVFT